MADGGELAAAFRALAEDAAQAGEDIGSSIGKWFDDTADIEDENVARTPAADSENARALNAIRPNADTGPLGDGAGGDAGDGAGSSAENRISRLLNGEEGDGTGAGGGEPGTGGSGSGLSDASGPSGSRSTGEMDTAGDPVDVATGDVVLSQADVTLAGVLPRCWSAPTGPRTAQGDGSGSRGCPASTSGLRSPPTGCSGHSPTGVFSPGGARPRGTVTSIAAGVCSRSTGPCGRCGGTEMPGSSLTDSEG